MNRILIISQHLMFGYGLESLLHQETGLNVVGWERNIAHATNTIKELEPDAVILDRDDTSFDFTSELLQILHLHPGLKVICVNLQDNNLHIYQSHQRVANDVEDLLEAIKEEELTFSPEQITGANWSDSLIAHLGDLPVQQTEKDSVR
jgi:DNA-binding NarL/FixJ family response regulator